MHVPLIQPHPEKDEPITLYLSRVRLLTHYTDEPLGWFAPSGLDRIIEPLSGLIGTWDELEPYNSFLPLQTRTMAKEAEAKYRDHCRRKCQAGFMAMIGMNGVDSGWTKPVLSFCPECAQRDVASCGTPFWNRKNLFPGLMYCSEHGRPLETSCGHCSGSIRLRRRSFPGSTCGCTLRPVYGAASLSSREVDAEIELHRIASLLIDPTYRPDIRADAFARAVMARSASLGLTTEEMASEKHFLNFVQGSPHYSILRRMRIVEGPIKMNMLLVDDRIHPNALKTIARTLTLFGSWDQFEKWVSENPSTGDVTGPSQKESKRSRAKAVEKLNACEEANRVRLRSFYIEEYSKSRLLHPHYSHQEIMEALPEGANRYIWKKILRENGVDVQSSEAKRSRTSRSKRAEQRRNWLSSNGDRLRPIFIEEYSKLRLAHPTHSHQQIMDALPDSARKLISKRMLQEIGVDVPPYQRSKKSQFKGTTYCRNWANANRDRWRPFFIEQYSKIRASHPTYTHREVMDALPGSAALFISKKMLVENGVDVPDAKPRLNPSNDAALREHVVARATYALENDYPHQISSVFLVSGHPSGTSFLMNKSAYPRTDAEVKLHAETYSKWRRRVLGGDEKGSTSLTKRSDRTENNAFLFIQPLTDIGPSHD